MIATIFEMMTDYFLAAVLTVIVLPPAIAGKSATRISCYAEFATHDILKSATSKIQQL